ncbi:MAG: P1 family peptidase [Nitrospirota bacterium]|nr:P1 family peptidase [Nitrospirota bacterium]
MAPSLFVLFGVFLNLLFAVPPTFAEGPERARDMGIIFEGKTGRYNAITDVNGVTVGHATVVSADTGPNAARTGVTVVFPGGSGTDERYPAATHVLNGNGEMTGTVWVAESGFLEGPVVLTNTHSVGTAHQALIAWGQRRFPGTEAYSLPVVAETWDGFLNDINGFHVTSAHVEAAIQAAASGPVAEGNVGGGTGMVAYRFKGGIGTASRVTDGTGYTVGVLVQANYGRREDLIISGVPVGRMITDRMPARGIDRQRREGSIVAVVATDSPLLPHQLQRLARRVPLALGKLGSVATNSSGDLFVAFSTALPDLKKGVERWRAVPNDALDPLFTAVIQATEEAVLNAMIAAKTMTGRDGNTVYALPHERLRKLLKP